MSMVVCTKKALYWAVLYEAFLLLATAFYFLFFISIQSTSDQLIQKFQNREAGLQSQVDNMSICYDGTCLLSLKIEQCQLQNLILKVPNK